MRDVWNFNCEMRRKENSRGEYDDGEESRSPKRRKRKPITAEEALMRMAALCARSEQCSFDIARKLRNMSLSESDVHSILSRLRKQKFVDDARYAGALARDKVRFQAWGKYKIKRALYSKQIPSKIIEDAIASIDETEYAEAAYRAGHGKLQSGLDLDIYDDKIKLMRYLLSRGFELPVCRVAFGRLLAEFHSEDMEEDTDDEYTE